MITLFTLIFYLVLLGFIWWLVQKLPIPEPIGQIVSALFVIIAIWMILIVFGIAPGSLPRPSIH